MNLLRVLETACLLTLQGRLFFFLHIYMHPLSLMSMMTMTVLKSDFRQMYSADYEDKCMDFPAMYIHTQVYDSIGSRILGIFQ